MCVYVDCKQLSCVSSVRYLGLHIDELLTWHQHRANVLRRVYSRMNCLYHLRPLPADLHSKLYRVFVLPILDCCDVVWTQLSVQHFKHLERLHLKFNSPPSSTDLSVCMTLTERRHFHKAMQVYKILHNLSPSYLNGTFRYAVDITGCATRNVHRLFIPRVQTALASQTQFLFLRNTDMELIKSSFICNKETPAIQNPASVIVLIVHV